MVDAIYLKILPLYSPELLEFAARQTKEIIPLKLLRESSKKLFAVKGF